MSKDKEFRFNTSKLPQSIPFLGVFALKPIHNKIVNYT